NHSGSDGVSDGLGDRILRRSEHLHGLLRALDGDLRDHHRRRLHRDVRLEHRQEIRVSSLLVCQRVREGVADGAILRADQEVDVGNLIPFACERLTDEHGHPNTSWVTDGAAREPSPSSRWVDELEPYGRDDELSFRSLAEPRRSRAPTLRYRTGVRAQLENFFKLSSAYMGLRDIWDPEEPSPAPPPGFAVYQKSRARGNAQAILAIEPQPHRPGRVEPRARGIRLARRLDPDRGRSLRGRRPSRTLPRVPNPASRVALRNPACAGAF